MQVVYYISHIINDSIIERYHKLKKELNRNEYDVFFLYSNYDDNECTLSDDVDYIELNRKDFDRLIDEGYYENPRKDQGFCFNNTHFIYLLGYQKHPTKYDHYWFIEYDVIFNGNWNNMIPTIPLEYDFVTSQIQHYNDYEDWWWHTNCNNIENIETEYKSLNPIMRISNKALEFLNKKCITKNGGFHEAMLITFLERAGFTFADIYKDRKYGGTNLGMFANEDTFDWYLRTFIIDKENYLYHPVK